MAWAAVATVVVGAVVASQSSRSGSGRYRPYGPWLEMKDDVMSGIQRGIAEGGYTWSEEVGEQLQRQALLDISRTYEGAERRAVEAMVPYGAVGAAGRTAQNIAIARGTEESSAIRGLFLAREEQKLSSLHQLIQAGAGMPDPNLPGASGTQDVRPSRVAQFAGSVEQGISGYMYQKEATKERDFWQNFMQRSQTRQSVSPSVSSQTPGQWYNSLGQGTGSYAT